MVYVLNGIGGRLDQTLANMNTLYSAEYSDDVLLYLMSEDSLSFVLDPVSLSMQFTIVYCMYPEAETSWGGKNKPEPGLD